MANLWNDQGEYRGADRVAVEQLYHRPLAPAIGHHTEVERQPASVIHHRPHNGSNGGIGLQAVTSQQQQQQQQHMSDIDSLQQFFDVPPTSGDLHGGHIAAPTASNLQAPFLTNTDILQQMLVGQATASNDSSSTASAPFVTNNDSTLFHHQRFDGGAFR